MTQKTWHYESMWKLKSANVSGYAYDGIRLHMKWSQHISIINANHLTLVSHMNLDDFFSSKPFPSY